MFNRFIFLYYFSLFLNVCLLSNIFFGKFSFRSSKNRFEFNPNRFKLNPNRLEEQSEYFQTMFDMTSGLAESKSLVETVEIVVYNLSRPLSKMADELDSCVLLNNIHPFYACLHDVKVDLQSQLTLTKWGIEPEVRYLTDLFFKSNPDAFYLDLGMNIGVHSFYAALLNPNIKVVAVEPFPKNVIRAHKGAYLNKIQDRIIVIMAAVSNKRGAVNFHEPSHNTGGSMVINEEWPDAKFIRKDFVSSAILFNDLLAFAPAKKALLKMDIEGRECYAFFNADKIFDRLDIPLIVMEVGVTFRDSPSYCPEAMLKFLAVRNYSAYPFPYAEVERAKRPPLNMTLWREWRVGDTVYFRKN